MYANVIGYKKYENSKKLYMINYTLEGDPNLKLNSCSMVS